MIQNIKTQEEARQYAIKWQNLISNEDVSLSEIIEAQAEFEELAERFNLTEEFKENGII